MGYQPTVSARVGTLGIGPEVSIRIPNSHWGFRGNINFFTYNDSSIYHHRFANENPTTGYDLDAQFGGSFRFFNGGLTTDFYPLGSGLRVSLGVYGVGNRVTARATPTGDARIGRTIYNVQDAGSVSLKALPNQVAPYIGFGYAGRIVSNVVFSVDAGILAEGDPKVSMTTEGPAAALPSFTAQVERERRRIAHDVNVPVYPVLELGIGYRF
ncbi:hypothetical protein AA102526_0733 [Asaia lannensis NBRC 102526]|nr:hypothetical protein AA102526_0733 [Asaia lannensis NBRC 102526]